MSVDSMGAYTLGADRRRWFVRGHAFTQVRDTLYPCISCDAAWLSPAFNADCKAPTQADAAAIRDLVTHLEEAMQCAKSLLEHMAVVQRHQERQKEAMD